MGALRVLVAVVVALSTVVVVVVREAESSCVQARLCCQGKDTKCIVKGQRVNTLEGPEVATGNGSCFCDAGCLDIGDCCTDYKDQCIPVDCVLADKWQDWEPCDASCGLGKRQRVRSIVQPPLNGGRPCGKTVQRGVCEGTRCKLPRASGTVEEIREIGKILPATFGGWRKNIQYNPYKDIRRNLFLQLESPIPHNRPSYCATYELKEVRPGCQLHPKNHPWTMTLTKGTSICVECQVMAMQKKLGGRCNGHGIYERETRWAAMGVPGCHGTWLMSSRRQDCECSDQGSSFILV